MAKFEFLTEAILATGALGTAAFGIVEGLKSTAAVGEAGFDELTTTLGPFAVTLQQAHGSDWAKIYRGLYRGDATELVRMLRQGVRVGLTTQNAATIGDALFGRGTEKANALVVVAGKVLSPDAKPSELELRALGRYELAADARIDAALAIARQQYATTARLWASVVSMVIALVTAGGLYASGGVIGLSTGGLVLFALLIGIAAVPIAPIAKDVASGIHAAARALRARG
jgi:hypothetical protein